LVHKSSLLCLLDLKLEKDLQLSHHRHLEFFAHVLLKDRMATRKGGE
jgi:hypothetical protein